MNEFLSNIASIKDAIDRNRLVIFVGAGVSNNSGLPSWEELNTMMYKQLDLSETERNDYLKIAELFKIQKGEKEYIESIRSFLVAGKTKSNPIYSAIFELNPCHVVTTNFDSLIEDYSKENNLPFQTIKSDKDLPYSYYENFIIKMHGDMSLGNIVLSEKDYINYSKNFPLIENYVKSLFATKLILFIGFSFKDYNLKSITNSIKNLLGKDFQPMYFLSNNPIENLEKKYFNENGLKIISYNNEISANTEPRTELSHEGNKLLRTLDYIRKFDIVMARTKWQNTIDKFMEMERYHFDEINFLGIYYIKNEIEGVQIVANDVLYTTISVNSPDLDELLNQKRDFASIKEFIIRHKSKFDILKERLFENNITRIIINGKAYNLSYEKKYRDNSALDLLTSYQIDKVDARIKELSEINELKTNIDDMLLPYLLYKRGRIKESLLLLENIINAYWENKKYILFFIGKYNLKCLHEILGIFDHKVNLNSLLSKLPIANKRIKELLYSLVDYSYVYDILTKMSDLKKKIIETKINIENEGVSINSHVESITENAIFLWSFCNKNYIFSEHHNEIVKAYKEASEAIIISHSIEIKNKTHPSSKLEHLYPIHIHLIITYLKPSDLLNIVKTNSIKEISFSLEGHNYFAKAIDGILKNINTRNKSNLFDIALNIEDQYQNALILISLLKVSKIQNDSIENQLNLIVSDEKINLFKIINGLKFFINTNAKHFKNPAPLKTLVNKLIQLPQRDSHIVANLIIKLCKTINAIDKNFLLEKDIAYTLYPKVGENNLVKISLFLALKDVIESSIFTLYVNEASRNYRDGSCTDLIYILLKNKVKVSKSTLINFAKVGLEKIRKGYVSIDSFLNTVDQSDLFALIIDIYKKNRTHFIEEETDFLKKIPLFLFLNNPLEYTYDSKFNIKWLLYLEKTKEKKIINALLKNKTFQQILLENADRILKNEKLFNLIFSQTSSRL